MSAPRHAGIKTGKVDRRIPYYLLEGCEYMLDARSRCDAAALAAPGGCCPIGFSCTAAKNKKVRPPRLARLRCGGRP